LFESIPAAAYLIEVELLPVFFFKGEGVRDGNALEFVLERSDDAVCGYSADPSGESALVVVFSDSVGVTCFRRLLRVLPKTYSFMASTASFGNSIIFWYWYNN